MRKLAVFLVVLSAALSASAQNVVVGQIGINGGGFFGDAAPFTVIDSTHPANAAGTVTTASVQWTIQACTGAFKVKFYRPNLAFTTLTLVAERGPFNAVLGRNIVQLSPPVALAKGDLIAVTALQSTSTCGSPAWTGLARGTAQIVSGDYAGGAVAGRLSRGLQVGVRATDTAEVLEGVITAAGSLQGNFGSFFRTALQISSPTGVEVTGKLVFHPAGTSSTANDQTFPYSFFGTKAVSYTDVVQFMGKSGLGTLDVISLTGPPPLVTARVYNDTPTGTSGFIEEAIRPQDALHAASYAVFVTPADLTNYRVNIGVRTIGGPATVNIQYGLRTQANYDFPANWFQQYSFEQLGNPSPVLNEQIFFSVLSGDVIIYASITDNRTNDSAIVFLKQQ